MPLLAAIYVSVGAAADTWVTPAMDVCVVERAGVPPRVMAAV